MVTRIKIDRDYILQGTVVDRATQRGVSGLLVIAWDHDTKYHDMLGQAVTDADGGFTIAFDADYFGDYAPDRLPDVFYKVSQGDNELLSTFDKPQMNLARGLTRVKLEVDQPQFVADGKDRIKAEQALKMVAWWEASDFRGAYTQATDKSKTVGRFAGSLFGDALKDFDFEPVRSKSTREREIVNQTPDSARAALAQQNVAVTGVQQADALGKRSNLKQLADYPLHLRSGDHVTLYEEDGVVKYYTLDSEPSCNADGAAVARIDGDLQNVKSQVASLDEMRTEIANVKAANADIATRTAEEAVLAQSHAQEIDKLQKQLAQVQQASAAKDMQINKLQTDLVQVTKAQDALAARLPMDRINALELQLSRLSGQDTPLLRPTGRQPAAAKPAAKAGAAKAPAKTAAKPTAKVAAPRKTAASKSRKGQP